MRIFISDCEGPISKNDNAFEVASHFIPKGDYLFSLLSKYDDVLAGIMRRPGYKAGYTLALITPFLKIHGVTNSKMRAYSAKNIILIRRAKEMLQQVKKTMPAFIVSTSYEQYLSSLCSLIDFPYENVYCTKLDLDKHTIDQAENFKLKQLEKEIISLPMIELPRGVTSIWQLPDKSREVVNHLDRFFVEEISSMAVGRMIEEVNPIGGTEKANVTIEISKRVECDLNQIMYVGDSITDVQVFQLVRGGGGLTVSFNGNEYAVRNAEFAVLSDRATVTSVLATVFFESGKDGVQKLVEEWSYGAVKKYCSDKTLVQEILNVYPLALPEVKIVTQDNVDDLVEASLSFRKMVRGEAIGRLG